MQAANKPAFHRRSIKPERFLALGFFLLIVAGGFVLTLPVSSADGRTVGIRQAMFSATSAVCVTGLSIVDVGVELSFFGQAVLLMLIQVGGLGFMAFATLIMVALGSLSALGYGPLAGVTVFGMQFLDFFDFLTNSVMMPIAAIAICLLVSRVIGVQKIEEEVTLGGKPFRRKKIFNFMIQYLCPIFAAIILISSVANALGWIAM